MNAYVYVHVSFLSVALFMLVFTFVCLCVQFVYCLLRVCVYEGESVCVCLCVCVRVCVRVCVCVYLLFLIRTSSVSDGKVSPLIPNALNEYSNQLSCLFRRVIFRMFSKLKDTVKLKGQWDKHRKLKRR